MRNDTAALRGELLSAVARFEKMSARYRDLAEMNSDEGDSAYILGRAVSIEVMCNVIREALRHHPLRRHDPARRRYARRLPQHTTESDDWFLAWCGKDAYSLYNPNTTVKEAFDAYWAKLTRSQQQSLERADAFDFFQQGWSLKARDLNKAVRDDD